jgi:hypothetical protein
MVSARIGRQECSSALPDLRPRRRSTRHDAARGVHESEAVGVVGFPQDQIFCPLIADPKEPRSFASLLRGTFPVD